MRERMTEVYSAQGWEDLLKDAWFELPKTMIGTWTGYHYAFRAAMFTDVSLCWDLEDLLVCLFWC